MTRKKLLNALDYPRFLVRDHLDLDECRHQGNYDRYDPKCGACSQQPECKWLVSHDEFSALEQKSTADLLESVKFAWLYVDAHVTFWGHNRHACACDACRWLRATNRLIEQAQASG